MRSTVAERRPRRSSSESRPRLPPSRWIEGGWGSPPSLAPWIPGGDARCRQTLGAGVRCGYMRANPALLAGPNPQPSRLWDPGELAVRHATRRKPAVSSGFLRADDGTRTHDLLHGKEASEFRQGGISQVSAQLTTTDWVGVLTAPSLPFHCHTATGDA